VRGAERAQILRHFYPTRGFHYAVIAEHGGYLRKACSYLCASHVGTGVVQDPTFLDPMQHYEDLYREYFDLYCSTPIPAEGVESASEHAFVAAAQAPAHRMAMDNPQPATERAASQT